MTFSNALSSVKARIIVVLTGALMIVAAILGAASPAHAATNTARNSVHHAGYSVVGGHIRYAAEAVQPRAVANPDGSQPFYHVGLFGNGHQANVYLVYNSAQGKWVASGGGGDPVFLDLTDNMASKPGAPVNHSVKLYVYYNQKTETATTSIRDENNNVLYSASFTVKGGMKFYSARLFEEFPGGSLTTEGGKWALPDTATVLDSFSNVSVTSYNGTHGGLTGIPWTTLYTWTLESQASGTPLVTPSASSASAFALTANAAG